jgi:hypothetical protein
VLHLFGANVRLIMLWCLLAAGLFQISDQALNPLAAFSFHYPTLGIQLSICLAFIALYLRNGFIGYVYIGLSFWLIFMLWYEVNLILIPISFCLVFASMHTNKTHSLLAISLYCSVYLLLFIYVKKQADGEYPGSAISLDPMLASIAYFKQLSGMLPGISYLSRGLQNISFESLTSKTLRSVVALTVFFLSGWLIYLILNPRSALVKFKAEGRSRPKKNLVIISIGMILLPAVFPAISMRYQNEVSWGAPALPVYYQNLGLAYFMATSILSLTRSNCSAAIFSFLIGTYLAFNLTANSVMASVVDNAFREPRESLIYAAKSGLFDGVKDGDEIRMVKVPEFLGSDFLYQLTKKRISVSGDNVSILKIAPQSEASVYTLEREISEPYRYRLYNALKEKSYGSYKLENNADNIFRVGFMSGDIGAGVKYYPVKTPSNFGVEILLVSLNQKKPNSTILSNHSDYRGFTIERDGLSPDIYNVIFGDGSRWLNAGKIKLQPNVSTHLSLQVNGSNVRVYVNGCPIIRRTIQGQIVGSDSPLFLGNWVGSGRNFSGFIEEVVIHEGDRSEQEIIAQSNVLGLRTLSCSSI